VELKALVDVIFTVDTVPAIGTFIQQGVAEYIGQWQHVSFPPKHLQWSDGMYNQPPTTTNKATYSVKQQESIHPPTGHAFGSLLWQCFIKRKNMETRWYPQVHTLGWKTSTAHSHRNDATPSTHAPLPQSTAAFSVAA
jgi:hypothetical protein